MAVRGAPAMKKNWSGGCHCGAVRFEATLDLADGTYRCNCSICAKTRFWPAIVPPESFRLVAGEEQLTEYLFHTRRNRHFFCKHCGVRAFGQGYMPDGTKIYGVNVVCLDGVTDAELAAAPITYVDGRVDRSGAPPAETRHL
jgi:hypothetical protein